MRRHRDLESSSSYETSETDKNNYTIEDFYTALDRIGDENLLYWKDNQRSLETYKDVHPAIICDTENKVEVYTRGAHKGMTGLNRVSIEHYFKTVQDKEQKSQCLYKSLRDRIDELESELRTVKVGCRRS